MGRSAMARKADKILPIKSCIERASGTRSKRVVGQLRTCTCNPAISALDPAEPCFSVHVHAKYDLRYHAGSACLAFQDKAFQLCGDSVG